MSDGTAIGIDLGTTYSCVAVFENDKVDVIANDQGSRITPSCVSFTDEERLIGESAANEMGMNPDNTVFDVKRMIGARFGDEDLEKNMKYWPFQVINCKGNPKIQVKFKGETRTFSPMQISAMVLEEMKVTAEMYLGQTVTDAVITVPAYFNDGQRKATKHAGEIAGLNVLRLINEPTAAAIAYGLDKKIATGTILVFDLGGGTFDVSILQIKNGHYQVKAVSGDTHLGGKDFDNRLVEYFAEEFKTKFRKNLSSCKRAMSKLRVSCEKAKRNLSTPRITKSRINVESLFEGIDFSTTLTKACFEKLNSDLFDKLLGPVEKALKDAKIRKDQIDEVVLVGGSTRIPKIQQILKEFFDGKVLHKNINPDEAVGFGAGVMAAAISGKMEKYQTLTFQDVIPLSLGIDVKGCIMSTVIERNTAIPVKKNNEFCTAEDNQSSAPFKVYEGERASTQKNYFLDRFDVTGFPRAPARQVKFDVTFDVDVNGILTVTAVTKGCDAKGKIVIDHDTGRFTKEEIDEMIKEAEKYKKEDEEYRKKVREENELEEFQYKFRSSLK